VAQTPRIGLERGAGPQLYNFYILHTILQIFDGEDMNIQARITKQSGQYPNKFNHRIRQKKNQIQQLRIMPHYLKTSNEKVQIKNKIKKAMRITIKKINNHLHASKFTIITYM
jgi:hypothetical protein